MSLVLVGGGELDDNFGQLRNLSGEDQSNAFWNYIAQYFHEDLGTDAVATYRRALTAEDVKRRDHENPRDFFDIVILFGRSVAPDSAEQVAIQLGKSVVSVEVRVANLEVSFFHRVHNQKTHEWVDAIDPLASVSTAASSEELQDCAVNLVQSLVRVVEHLRSPLLTGPKHRPFAGGEHFLRRTLAVAASGIVGFGFFAGGVAPNVFQLSVRELLVSSLLAGIGAAAISFGSGLDGTAGHDSPTNSSAIGIGVVLLGVAVGLMVLWNSSVEDIAAPAPAINEFLAERIDEDCTRFTWQSDNAEETWLIIDDFRQDVEPTGFRLFCSNEDVQINAVNADGIPTGPVWPEAMPEPEDPHADASQPERDDADLEVQSTPNPDTAGTEKISSPDTAEIEPSVLTTLGGGLFEGTQIRMLVSFTTAVEQSAFTGFNDGVEGDAGYCFDFWYETPYTGLFSIDIEATTLDADADPTPPTARPIEFVNKPPEKLTDTRAFAQRVCFAIPWPNTSARIAATMYDARTGDPLDALYFEAKIADGALYPEVADCCEFPSNQ